MNDICVHYSVCERREYCKDIECSDYLLPRETTRRIIVGKTTKHYACEKCESPIDIQDRYCRTCGAKIVENLEVKE